jgi:hypothetical protein
MPNFIWTTCGTQYADSDQPPAAGPTLDKLRLTNRGSRAFEGVPIYLHAANRQRVMRLDKALVSGTLLSEKLKTLLTNYHPPALML